MVNKNLFLYDLAVVAIFKDEARYLKEWLDYHLLAGVDHFYLYNNDSTDDYREVLAPYVEANLVTLIDFPGKVMQHLAYQDAIEKFRFECRFMAFIDLDEFIFPKTNQKISEVVDEILSRDENAAALGINWQCFGSNGHEMADYSRGVLERFTRRALDNETFLAPGKGKAGNTYIKTVANPRLVMDILSPHYCSFFSGKFSINSDGGRIPYDRNDPVLTDKIVINHYIVKSREEFLLKIGKGRAASKINPDMSTFFILNRNDVFDDGILKYRAEREKIFSFESNEQRISRVINSLVQTLTQNPPLNLETFLTCRAATEKFQIKIGSDSAEEFALAWIYRTLTEPISYTEIQMILRALPEILSRPFSVCGKINHLVCENIFPRFYETLRNANHKSIEDVMLCSKMIYIQKLLSLIKL